MDTPISTEILLKYLTSSTKGIVPFRREAVRRENCQKNHGEHWMLRRTQNLSVRNCTFSLVPGHCFGDVIDIKSFENLFYSIKMILRSNYRNPIEDKLYKK